MHEVKMPIKFFKPHSLATQSDAEEGLIKTLVAITHSKYDIKLINSIPPESLPILQALVIKLGEQLLLANSKEDAALYKESKKKLHEAMHQLFDKTVTFPIIVFSAQLVQYYTLVSDPAFNSHLNATEFMSFLKNNSKFGDCSANLLVTELKLIKIYNDFCIQLDEEAGIISKAKKSKINASVVVGLEEIREQLTTVLNKDDPTNIFAHYLNFIYHYCQAKKLEFVYVNTKDSHPESNLSLTAQQDEHLKQAKEAMTNIKTIQEYPLITGVEFSLGQDLFHKLPISDMDTIHTHVTELART